MPASVSARLLLVVLAACAAVVPHAVAAQSAPVAGRVKVAVGTATIVRGGQATPATVGAEVLEADVLRTGADGQLAVMLKDETRLSLAPGAEVTLSAFTYVPSENRLALVLRVARGALSYVSGRIAKLLPEAVRLETPTAVIGVRGTHALVRVEAP